MKRTIRRSIRILIIIIISIGIVYIISSNGRTTEYADITEEEFHAMRNRYATNVERLDWKPLEGFWNP